MPVPPLKHLIVFLLLIGRSRLVRGLIRHIESVADAIVSEILERESDCRFHLIR